MDGMSNCVLYHGEWRKTLDSNTILGTRLFIFASKQLCIVLTVRGQAGGGSWHLCMHPSECSVAFLIPSHDSGGWGSLKRRSPTGGLAKGIPQNAYDSSSSKPRSLPCVVVTTRSDGNAFVVGGTVAKTNMKQRTPIRTTDILIVGNERTGLWQKIYFQVSVQFSVLMSCSTETTEID